MGINATCLDHAVVTGGEGEGDPAAPQTEKLHLFRGPLPKSQRLRAASSIEYCPHPPRVASACNIASAIRLTHHGVRELPRRLGVPQRHHHDDAPEAVVLGVVRHRLQQLGVGLNLSRTPWAPDLLRIHNLFKVWPECVFASFIGIVRKLFPGVVRRFPGAEAKRMSWTYEAPGELRECSGDPGNKND
eukprot:14656113-Alexandrium_andersonii.AAC.2